MSDKDFEVAVAAPAVVARNVWREYRSLSSKKSLKRQKVKAVRNVSLAALQGESVGLLGQNGSGKSTFLRMIAGAEKPSSGSVFVRSQPTLLGVSAALVPHLSGAKNIRLGCLAMGLSPEESDAVFEDIVQMADIGDAIYRPMDTYSSGMAARLKFSIGTANSPELLLIDEALSTGDQAFAAKAEARMQKMLDGAGTLFLVSHAAKVVERNCKRSVWLHEGEVVADGPSEEVCQHYRVWVQHRADQNMDKADALLEEVRNSYKEPIILFDEEVIGE